MQLTCSLFLPTSQDELEFRRRTIDWHRKHRTEEITVKPTVYVKTVTAGGLDRHSQVRCPAKGNTVGSETSFPHNAFYSHQRTKQARR